jgi:hypothetical protein
MASVVLYVHLLGAAAGAEENRTSKRPERRCGTGVARAATCTKAHGPCDRENGEDQMSDKSSGDSKWKDHLLRSSLPLEQLVAEAMERHGLYVAGEYPYTRPNELELDREFSVDLHAFELLPRRSRSEGSWGALNLLVECKYSYPGVQWIFTPCPPSSLIVVGCIKRLEDLCTERLIHRKITSRDPLYALDYSLPFCVTGVALHTGGADQNTISHGLNQLRYGLPNLIAQECRNQIETRIEEDLRISFVCPVLVTTASLHILKRGLSLSDYQDASQLSDVADDADALIVFREVGPDLFKYSTRIAERLHERHPAIVRRLDDIEDLLDPSQDEVSVRIVGATKDTFDSRIAQEYSRILVVRFSALDQILEIVRRSVRKAGTQRKRIGSLTPYPDDHDQPQVIISAITD